MTRVSLKEAYDNKDVVAQIYAIRDIAEGAEDTANNAVSTANTASEHVDALAPQVEGAVQNANNASASAQASAQTVAGYENRLSNVELKITTAEGQIVTIQGRVTALETADGQNVKIDRINDYAVGLTGNQTALGEKMGLWHGYRYTKPAPTTPGKWLRYMSIPTRYTVTVTEIIGTNGNNGYCYAKAITSGANGYGRIYTIDNQPGNSGIKVVCALNTTDNRLEFWIYVPEVNNVSAMAFYSTYIDSHTVDNAIYHNTEHDALPSDGYTSFTYILGVA